MVWKPFQQCFLIDSAVAFYASVAGINSRTRGIGSPAGVWLQAACSHQDFTWMRLEEGRKAKPSGWYLDFGKLAFPYESDLVGSCHTFLLWGLHGVVCTRGSAVATSSAAFLEVREDTTQSCSAGMLPCACSHICIWRNNKALLSLGLAPSSCCGHRPGDYVLINLERC